MIGTAHRTTSLWLSHHTCLLSVRHCFPIGNLLQRLPCLLLKIRSLQAQRYIEGSPLPLKVLLQLFLSLLKHFFILVTQFLVRKENPLYGPVFDLYGQMAKRCVHHCTHHILLSGISRPKCAITQFSIFSGKTVPSLMIEA